MVRFHRLATVSVLAVILSLSGCGQSGSPPPASIPGSAGQNSPPLGTSSPDTSKLGPQETVVRYLDAVKAGDERAVASLLTEVARRKTAELNIAVAPPGNDTASFSVGDMEYITPTKDTAHVACMWTDVDEQGKPQTLRIIWVVRHEAIGWRIAGMVTRMAPDQPLLVLNFEEPEEVIRRQTAAQEEASRREAAQRPGTPAKEQTPATNSSAPVERGPQQGSPTMDPRAGSAFEAENKRQDDPVQRR